jgi:hypothetical protein
MLRCEDSGWVSGDEEDSWIAVVLEIDPHTGQRVVLINCPRCAEQFEDCRTSLSPTDSSAI